MRAYDLLLLAFSTSMDAFAVSVCKGLAAERQSLKNTLLAGLWFGSFQALMPALGYLLGAAFGQVISDYDHWIIFFLLTLLGGNMLREAALDAPVPDSSFGARAMLIMALATSIDAMAVGITLAFTDAHILFAASLIGITAFLLSCAGIQLGRLFGARFRKPAERAGGVILILLGAKNLLEHLGCLPM